MTYIAPSVTRLGYFWKVLVTNFPETSWTILGHLRSVTFWIKSNVATFWATFGKMLATFIRSSGHTDCRWPDMTAIRAPNNNASKENIGPKRFVIYLYISTETPTFHFLPKMMDFSPTECSFSTRPFLSIMLLLLMLLLLLLQKLSMLCYCRWRCHFVTIYGIAILWLILASSVVATWIAIIMVAADNPIRHYGCKWPFCDLVLLPLWSQLALP